MSAPKPLKKNDSKTINAWAMYDWANSAFALVIVSAIFPAYYNEVTRLDGSDRVDFFGIDIENTAIYSICLGVAFGIVGLISPLLSSIADYLGNHGKFMKFFCYLGGSACAGLFLFTGENLEWGLAMLLLATISYSGSIVFYNSYLPAIASEDRQDKVSARGYAFGYVGASTLLIINLVFILNQEALGVTDGTLLPRISFLLTGLWWIGFAQITFRKLPAGIYKRQETGNPLLNGYRELQKVFRNIIHEKKVLRIYLFGFFFYIMGVQTVMFMATSFGEKEIGLSVTLLIATALSLEYIAIAGAFLFAWLSEQYGNFSALAIAIITWIGICSGAMFIQNPLHFFIAAFFIGIVMGGIQSLSRSTYAKLIPKTENNAGYFSFYDVCEKIAIMLGLVMFGSLDNLTGSMRNSIFVLVVWFIISLFFMVRLQLSAGKSLTWKSK